MVTHKQCTGCKEIKPLDQFAVNNRRKSGYDARCAQCVSDYQKAYKEAKAAKAKPKAAAAKPEKKLPVFAKPFVPPAYRFHPVGDGRECIECGRELPGADFAYRSYACHECTHAHWKATEKERVKRTRMGLADG